MHTVHVDRLVYIYLKDLDTELRGLPDSQRREILEEVREHISEARAAHFSETATDIRTVLERLGDPAEIAGEARNRFGVVNKPGTPVLEIATLVLMVIPFAGWVLSAVLLWLSNMWTRGDKVVGTIGALAFIPVGAFTVLDSVSRLIDQSPVGSPVTDAPTPGEGEPLALWLIVVVLAVPIATAIYLGIRLRARRQTVAATP
jgi:uncharacterized membrane protein